MLRMLRRSAQGPADWLTKRLFLSAYEASDDLEATLTKYARLFSLDTLTANLHAGFTRVDPIDGSAGFWSFWRLGTVL